MDVFPQEKEQNKEITETPTHQCRDETPSKYHFDKSVYCNCEINRLRIQTTTNTLHHLCLMSVAPRPRQLLNSHISRHHAKFKCNTNGLCGRTDLWN